MASTEEIDIVINARTERAANALKKLGLAFTAFSAAVIANTFEAQKATAQLDSAFASVSKTVGVTRKSLDDLATSLQNTTTFGDDLVKEAESILLTFNRVRGEAFERTIKSAADLSARFGTDLVSATKLLGKALQDPIRGLTQLRRSGVTFTESQVNLIKSLVETGDRVKAQDLILAEVEKRFKGAALAAGNTLGGALERLKNIFGDLFEASDQSTAAAVESINQFSKALQDPKIKQGIDNLIAAFAKLIELTVRFLALVADLSVKFGDFIGKNLAKLMGVQNNQEKINSLLKEELELRKLIAQGRQNTPTESFLKGSKGSDDAFREEIEQKGIRPENEKAFFEQRLRVIEAQRKALQASISTTPITDALNKAQSAAGSTGAPPTSVEDEEDARIRAANAVAEVEITLRKKVKDSNQAYFEDLDEATRTSTERSLARFDDIKVALDDLLLNKKISPKVFNERLGEAQDELLPEIDIQKIRDMYKKVESQATETAGIIKGAFEQAGANIQANLSDAIQSGKLSFKSLVDVARKAVADILSAIIVSGIKKAITAQLSASSSGGSASSGATAGAAASIIGAFVGARASGGDASSPFIAGEEGPELIDPRGSGVKVFNKRQLQFAGASRGANVFAPQTNIQIIERDNPERTKQEIFSAVALQNARNEERFMTRLAKNGVLVR